MTNVVGYARVSKREQNPAAQEAELRAAGAVRVFVDHGESGLHRRPSPSGSPASTTSTRATPSWCTAWPTRGRSGSSSRRCTTSTAEVNIKSLTEPMIDTTTPMGRALFGMVAVFAQLRVDTIRRKPAMRGLAHAKSREKSGAGRQKMTPEDPPGAARVAPRTAVLTTSPGCSVSGSRRRPRPQQGRSGTHSGPAVVPSWSSCSRTPGAHQRHSLASSTVRPRGLVGWRPPS